MIRSKSGFENKEKEIMKKTVCVLAAVAAAGALGGNMEIVAHRGDDKAKYPENTLASLAAAWKNGATYVETDFIVTNSGSVVVCHSQAELKSVWGSDKKLSRLTEEDISKITLKDSPKWSKDFGSERLPTLDEVFDIFPKDKGMVFEIKGQCNQRMVDVMEAARARNGIKKEQIIVHAFDADAIRIFNKLNPGYKTVWIFKLEDGEKRISAEDAIAKCKEIGARGVNVKISKLTEDYVRKLKAAGLYVIVWFVSDEDAIRRMESWGVDAVICFNAVEMIHKLKKDRPLK
jgi:glycerophosphoryl diester phosphodiesterase